MVKSFGLLGFLLVLLTGLLVACGNSSDTTTAGGATGTGTPPRITVDNQVLDYGNVRFNEWVKPSFTIQNTGGANLTLQKPTVKTLEGC